MTFDVIDAASIGAALCRIGAGRMARQQDNGSAIRVGLLKSLGGGRSYMVRLSDREGDVRVHVTTSNPGFAILQCSFPADILAPENEDLVSVMSS